MSDNVKNPAHYTQGDIECKDAIEAALTKEEFRGWCKGNAIKYIWREKYKGGDEDIKKAIAFLGFIDSYEEFMEVLNEPDEEEANTSDIVVSDIIVDDHHAEGTNPELLNKNSIDDEIIDIIKAYSWTGWAYLSHRQISDLVGVSPSTVRNHVKRLEKAGRIAYVPGYGGKGHCGKYRVLRRRD